MMNQRPSYDELQIHTYREATKLATYGKEFSHLVKILNPEYALRLKIFVQNLPSEVSSKTIYGRAVTNNTPLTAKQKKIQGKK
jgi:hypothetical protein